MSWSSTYPAPKKPKQKERGGSRSSNGSSQSSKSSRKSNSGRIASFSIPWIKRLTMSDFASEKHSRADKKSRERSRIGDEEDRRYERKTAELRVPNEDGESGSTQHGPGHDEPIPRIQGREHQRDDARRVRWRNRDDSSREGSDSRTNCRPRERRRKSRKLQDPGFADQMD